MLTMLKLWSHPKKNGQFLLELEEHNFHPWLLPVHYLYIYLHTVYVDMQKNCKQQGARPFNELLQT